LGAVVEALSSQLNNLLPNVNNVVSSIDATIQIRNSNGNLNSANYNEI